MYNTIDISTARKTLSQIINNVFLSGENYIITKRNIPLAKVVKVDLEKESPYFKEKKLDLSLFGVIKDNKKTPVQISNTLRKKVWRRI